MAWSRSSNFFPTGSMRASLDSFFICEIYDTNFQRCWKSLSVQGSSCSWDCKRCQIAVQVMS